MSKPKVVGVMRLNRGQLWQASLHNVAELCDKTFVVFDGVCGDPEILKQYVKIQQGEHGEKMRFQPVVVSALGWRSPDWKQECLEVVDAEKPDVVVFIDEDESFDADFADELQAFWLSDKRAMMIGFHPPATMDGRVANKGVPYPPEPHMKVFKWRAGLSYFPYHTNGIVAQYVNKDFHWAAKSKLQHTCFWTKAMEDHKKYRSPNPTTDIGKSVTILGFGPSVTSAKIHGEVWTLNNAYEVFEPHVWKRVTRLFEMHQPRKREMYAVKDGKTHFWHLNRIGNDGVRVVMQKKMDCIYNSEAFPIERVISEMGLSIFGGTGAYMVAMAALEGYSEIWIYGFDQGDYEHVLQRESMTGWLCYALGRGIQIGGSLAFLDRHKRRYGYEYGPEWDDQMNRDLWSGFPFEITFKDENRAQAGKMYDMPLITRR